jgi:branched-chain amino acid transport system substrate-binding protein
MRTSHVAVGRAAIRLTFALSLLLAVNAGHAQTKSPIKIGVIQDVSAAAAAMGQTQRNTYNLFAKEINEKGGIDGHPLELLFADGQSDPARVTQLAEKFATVDGVLALVGGTNTVEVLAMKSVAVRRKLVLLAGGGAAVVLSKPVDPWTFQNMGRDDNTLADMAKVAVDDLKLKKIGILNVNNAFGMGGRDVMVRVLKEKYGMEPVAIESTETAAVSMVPQMLRLKNAGADGVLLWVSIDSVPTALRGMVEVGYNVPVLSNLACTAANIKLTGNIPIRHISHAAWSWDRPDAMAVSERLEKFTGTPMKYEDTWPMAWNVMQVLVEGLRKGNLSFDPKNLDADRQKLRDAIEAIKNMPVIGGSVGATFSFGPDDHLGYEADIYVSKETSNGVDWQMYKPKK